MFIGRYGNYAPEQIAGIMEKSLKFVKPQKIIRDMMVKLFVLNPLICPSLIIDGYIWYTWKKFKSFFINLKFRHK